MTVQPATRMWSSNTSAYQTEDQRNFTYTKSEGWQVVHDPTDTDFSIAAAPDLPQLGQILPGTYNVRVVAQNPTQVSPVMTVFDIQYAGEIHPADPAIDPSTITPLTYEWGKVTTDEPTDQDIDGKAIVTANGERIDGVTRPLTDLTITIEQTYDAIDVPATQAYLHSVNSDIWPPASVGSFQPGQGQMTEFSARQVIASEVGTGSGYFEVRFTVQFREPYNTTPEKAWYRRVRHEGYLYKNDEGKIVQAITPGTKELSTRPVLLKADGTLELDPNNADWLEFKVFNPLPYNNLGLRWP